MLRSIKFCFVPSWFWRMELLCHFEIPDHDAPLSLVGGVRNIDDSVLPKFRSEYGRAGEQIVPRGPAVRSENFKFDRAAIFFHINYLSGSVTQFFIRGAMPVRKSTVRRKERMSVRNLSDGGRGRLQ